MFFSAFNISVNTTHPEILRYSRLICETKINWRGHEIFFKELLGYEMFSFMVPCATKYFLKKF